MQGVVLGGHQQELACWSQVCETVCFQVGCCNHFITRGKRFTLTNNKSATPDKFDRNKGHYLCTTQSMLSQVHSLCFDSCFCQCTES